VALGVFALRSLWSGIEALRVEPRRPGRAMLEFAFVGIDVLLILWITGAIP
jgi:hypothetical protein